MDARPKFVDEDEGGSQEPSFPFMAELVGEWYQAREWDKPEKYSILYDHWDAIAWCYVYARGEYEGGRDIPGPYVLGIRNAYQYIVDSYGKPVYNEYTLKELLGE